MLLHQHGYVSFIQCTHSVPQHSKPWRIHVVLRRVLQALRYLGSALSCYIVRASVSSHSSRASRLATAFWYLASCAGSILYAPFCTHPHPDSVCTSPAFLRTQKVSFYCALQGSLALMAFIHGYKSFAHHQIYTLRMGHDPWQSAPRFIIDWIILMTVECACKVRGWRAARRHQREKEACAAAELADLLVASSGEAAAIAGGSSGSSSGGSGTSQAGRGGCSRRNRSRTAREGSTATEAQRTATTAVRTVPRSTEQPISIADVPVAYSSPAPPPPAPATLTAGAPAPTIPALGHTSALQASVLEPIAEAENEEEYVSIRKTRIHTVSTP